MKEVYYTFSWILEITARVGENTTDEPRRFLLDTNIIRGARSGNKTCDLILNHCYGFYLLITKEVADELGKRRVPRNLDVIPARVSKRRRKPGPYRKSKGKYDYMNPE